MRWALIKAESGPGFSFGVRAWTEMEIWCIKGVCMLKVGLKGFRIVCACLAS